MEMNVSIRKNRQSAAPSRGFTVVELVIVITVIAILTAIVIVSYNAVRNNAIETTLKSDLDGASALIERDRLKNDGDYPADIEDLNGGDGLPASGTNEFEYVATGTAYCISITSPSTSAQYHYMSTTRVIEEGPCGSLEPTGPLFVSTLLTGLNYPTGIAIVSTQFIYIAETGANRILKVLPDGSSTVFAGSTTGASGFTNSPTGTSARFNLPYGLGVDAAGNLYVADKGNNAIRKITPDGAVTTLAGTGSRGSTNGPGASATFWDPYAVSIDPATNDIYTTETGTHRVRSITPAGYVSAVAGSTVGYQNGTGSGARFDDPLGMTFYNNIMYVSEYSNHTIRAVTKAGAVTTAFGSTTSGFADGSSAASRFNSPSGLAVRGNSLFIADSLNHRIRIANLSTNTVSTYAGSGSNGSSDDEADTAQFSFPTGVAAAPNGIVYVVETDAGRIRRIQ